MSLVLLLKSTEKTRPCVTGKHNPVDSFSVDPPEAPEQDKQVRNLTYQIVAMNSDYTFNMNVTWLPPVYPHKVIDKYYVSWRKFTQPMPLNFAFGNYGFTEVSRDLIYP